MNIFKKASELVEENYNFAIATITRAQGSTPRSNAKMIITENDKTYGTIGGGLSEAYVIEEAKKAIKEGKSRSVSYILDDGKSENSIHMLCGGNLEIFIECIPSSKKLLLIGGGHVNSEIAKTAAHIGFRIELAETRKDFASAERFPMAKKIVCRDTIEEAVSELTIDSRTAVVVATHDHDLKAIEAVLSSESPYIGFLGSRKKTAFFKRELLAHGFSEKRVASLYAPIGLDIGSESPEEIALSITAEILMTLNNTSGLPLKNRAENLVIVRGAGDIASGTIHRLIRSGYRVLALEMEKPTVIRRTVSYASAVYEGSIEIDGIKGELAGNYSEAKSIMDEKKAAVLIDPAGESINHLRPNILVDAVLAKKNIGTSIDMAPIVIALGPGFTAGTDAHAVIETNRGHYLGSVIHSGNAQENTGIPGNIAGESERRVLRAPTPGVFSSEHSIGDHIEAGETLAWVDKKAVITEISGTIRGLLADNLHVTEGFKVGDVDPRNNFNHCFSISDKARSVAGGVLEAILYYSHRNS